MDFLKLLEYAVYMHFEFSLENQKICFFLFQMVKIRNFKLKKTIFYFLIRVKNK